MKMKVLNFSNKNILLEVIMKTSYMFGQKCFLLIIYEKSYQEKILELY